MSFIRRYPFATPGATPGPGSSRRFSPRYRSGGAYLVRRPSHVAPWGPCCAFARPDQLHALGAENWRQVLEAYYPDSERTVSIVAPGNCTVAIGWREDLPFLVLGYNPYTQLRNPVIGWRSPPTISDIVVHWPGLAAHGVQKFIKRIAHSQFNNPWYRAQLDDAGRLINPVSTRGVEAGMRADADVSGGDRTRWDVPVPLRNAERIPTELARIQVGPDQPLYLGLIHRAHRPAGELSDLLYWLDAHDYFLRLQQFGSGPSAIQTPFTDAASNPETEAFEIWHEYRPISSTLVRPLNTMAGGVQKVRIHRPSAELRSGGARLHTQPPGVILLGPESALTFEARTTTSSYTVNLYKPTPGMALTQSSTTTTASPIPAPGGVLRFEDLGLGPDADPFAYNGVVESPPRGASFIAAPSLQVLEEKTARLMKARADYLLFTEENKDKLALYSKISALRADDRTRQQVNDALGPSPTAYNAFEDQLDRLDRGIRDQVDALVTVLRSPEFNQSLRANVTTETITVWVKAKHALLGFGYGEEKLKEALQNTEIFEATKAIWGAAKQVRGILLSSVFAQSRFEWERRIAAAGRNLPGRLRAINGAMKNWFEEFHGLRFRAKTVQAGAETVEVLEPTTTRAEAPEIFGGLAASSLRTLKAMGAVYALNMRIAAMLKPGASPSVADQIENWTGLANDILAVGNSLNSMVQIADPDEWLRHLPRQGGNLLAGKIASMSALNAIGTVFTVRSGLAAIQSSSAAGSYTTARAETVGLAAGFTLGVVETAAVLGAAISAWVTVPLALIVIGASYLAGTSNRTPLGAAIAHSEFGEDRARATTWPLPADRGPSSTTHAQAFESAHYGFLNNIAAQNAALEGIFAPPASATRDTRGGALSEATKRTLDAAGITDVDASQAHAEIRIQIYGLPVAPGNYCLVQQSTTSPLADVLDFDFRLQPGTNRIPNLDRFGGAEIFGWTTVTDETAGRAHKVDVEIVLLAAKTASSHIFERAGKTRILATRLPTLDRDSLAAYGRGRNSGNGGDGAFTTADLALLTANGDIGNRTRLQTALQNFRDDGGSAGDRVRWSDFGVLMRRDFIRRQSQALSFNIA